MNTAQNVNFSHPHIRLVTAEPDPGGGAPEPLGSGAAPAVMEWSVGAVATQVDVSANTLRTWERRYGLAPSGRTGGGHRRYTSEDVARIRVLTRLIGRGVPAQSAARVAMSLDQRRLLSEDPTAGL